jgi:tetratricopeptide (TPR) repeat protein
MTEPGVLEQARDLIRRGERAAAVQQLLAAIPNLSGQFQRKAQSYAGLAFYFEQQWQDALKMFQAAAAGSEVPEDWFNVAMAQVRLGDIEGAHASWQRFFDLSYSHKDAPETSTFFQKKLMFAQLLLSVGAADARGVDLLQRQLLPFFINNRVTDTHFWVSRGVPDFQEVLTALRGYYRTLGKPEAEWTALCNQVAQAVDEEGQALCEALKSGYRLP